jgi:hypothetical protein
LMQGEEFVEVKVPKIRLGMSKKNPTGDHAIIVHLKEKDGQYDDGAGIFLGENSATKVFFEDELLEPLHVPDLYDRIVEFKEPRWIDGTMIHGRITIKGGADPRQYRYLMSLDTSRAKIDKHQVAIVEKGMGSTLYHTREAATNVMIRKGLDALQALKLGLKSKDLEVSTRCQCALETIRTGVEH